MSTSIGNAAGAPTAMRSFYPYATVKSSGPTSFRTQAMRDLACLLDVDPDVGHWSCQRGCLQIGQTVHVIDFEVSMTDGRAVLMDVDDRDIPAWVPEEARVAGLDYRAIRVDEMIQGHRLRNARDLLRYGNCIAPLGDRVMLLKALDDQGSLPISECLQLIRETRPMAGLASMILHGHVQVDLDDDILGPETLVRRIRD